MCRPGSRPLLATVAALSIVAVTWVSVPVAAEPAEERSGDEDVTTTTSPVGATDADADVDTEGAGDIIRKPDSGRHPDDAGDRGGALQVILFLAMIGGVGTIVVLIRREIRPRSSPSPGP